MRLDSDLEEMRGARAMNMKNISISGFKARCLRLIEELDHGGEPIVITKRGRPVARVLPFHDAPPRSWLGSLRGTASIREDLVEPVTPERDF